jgi:hypothetical protein
MRRRRGRGGRCGFRPVADDQQPGSVRPAAAPARVPAKPGPADYRRDHHRRRHHHDPRDRRDRHHVGSAPAKLAAMRAGAATSLGLSIETDKGEQRGECGNRKEFSAHLLGCPQVGVIRPWQIIAWRMRSTVTAINFVGDFLAILALRWRAPYAGRGHDGAERRQPAAGAPGLPSIAIALLRCSTIQPRAHRLSAKIGVSLKIGSMCE